jgi:hypothetical protein
MDGTVLVTGGEFDAGTGFNGIQVLASAETYQ